MELKTYPLGQYDDQAHNVWNASLEIGGEHPFVILKQDAGPAERYRLSQFLSIGARCADFLISAIEVGDAEFTLGAKEVNDIASHALGRLSRQDGHYEIRWVPNDPSMPF